MTDFINIHYSCSELSVARSTRQSKLSGCPALPLHISHRHSGPVKTPQVIFHDRRALRLQFGSNLLDVGPDAQDVGADDLGGIGVRHPAPQQLGDEIRVLGDVVEALGRRRDAVEVAAEPHMVVPDQVADVRDVVGYVGEGVVRRVEVRHAVRVVVVHAADEVGREVDFVSYQY